MLCAETKIKCWFSKDIRRLSHGARYLRYTFLKGTPRWIRVPDKQCLESGMLRVLGKLGVMHLA